MLTVYASCLSPRSSFRKPRSSRRTSPTYANTTVAPKPDNTSMSPANGNERRVQSPLLKSDNHLQDRHARYGGQSICCLQRSAATHYDERDSKGQRTVPDTRRHDAGEASWNTGYAAHRHIPIGHPRAVASAIRRGLTADLVEIEMRDEERHHRHCNSATEEYSTHSLPERWPSIRTGRFLSS